MSDHNTQKTQTHNLAIIQTSIIWIIIHGLLNQRILKIYEHAANLKELSIDVFVALRDRFWEAYLPFQYVYSIELFWGTFGSLQDWTAFSPTRNGAFMIMLEYSSVHKDKESV